MHSSKRGQSRRFFWSLGRTVDCGSSITHELHMSFSVATQPSLLPVRSCDLREDITSCTLVCRRARAHRARGHDGGRADAPRAQRRPRLLHGVRSCSCSRTLVLVSATSCSRGQNTAVQCSAHRYLVQHLDWLTAALGESDDEDYVLLDCPGQIELYTHLPVRLRLRTLTLDFVLSYCASVLISRFATLPCAHAHALCAPQVMRALCEHLSERLHFRVCAVFLLDAQFLNDASKLVSGLFAALSVMIRIGAPHVSWMMMHDDSVE